MAVSAAATELQARGGLRVQLDTNNDQYQVCPLCGANQAPPVDADSPYAALSLRGWAAAHFQAFHGGTLEDNVFLGFVAPPPAAAPVVSGAPGATTIGLDWPNVYDADSYIVERATTPFSAFAAVAGGSGGTPTDSSTTVSGLVTATGYQFRLRSVKGGFISAPGPASATITTA